MELWPGRWKELGMLVATGKLKYRETIAPRIEDAPEASALLRGELRQTAGEAALRTTHAAPAMHAFILHHYANSPFSEKVRLVFGAGKWHGSRCTCRA